MLIYLVGTPAGQGAGVFGSTDPTGIELENGLLSG